MTKVKWRMVMVMAAILGGAWIYVAHAPSDADIAQAVAARVDFLAPDLALTTLDGKMISLKDLRGQLVLVNFWATWCQPCRAEMQEIQTAYQNHPNEFIVLAVNTAEGEIVVRKFVDEFHLPFPILLDPDGATAQAYRVQGLPTSYFIDRSGMVRAAKIGGMNRAYIETQIASLAAR